MSKRHDTTRSLFLLLALGVLTSSVTVAEEQKAAPAPKIVVDQTVIQAGDLDRGTLPKVTVRYRNTGSAPLEVQPLAGEALRVVRPPTPTAPGAEGSFEVELDTIFGDGESVWQLGLKTNDPDNPVVATQIVATIKTYVIAHPRELRWITTSDEAPATLKVTLQGVGKEPFGIRKLTSPHPSIKLSSEAGAPTAEGQATWIVSATLDPKDAVGPISGAIIIDLDHPKQPRARQVVSGFVRPAAAAPTNQEMDFGTKTLSELAEAPLGWQVRFFSEKKTDIAKITVTPPVFDAEAAPSTDPRWRMVLLRPNDKTPTSGEVRVQLQVDFSNPAFAPVSGKLKVAIVAEEDE